MTEDGRPISCPLISVLRHLNFSVLVVNTAKGFDTMSKRELIDCICEINKSAKAEFLATFSEDELKKYLEHLMELDLEEILVCA
jgi:mRNA-degrading endonuclease toxin of MazEF toxin-antitoxin module